MKYFGAKANKWLITSAFAGLLIFSLIYILKLRWQHVILAVLATAGTSFLSASPLIPMITAIAGLSDHFAG